MIKKLSTLSTKELSDGIKNSGYTSDTFTFSHFIGLNDDEFIYFIVGTEDSYYIHKRGINKVRVKYGRGTYTVNYCSGSIPVDVF